MPEKKNSQDISEECGIHLKSNLRKRLYSNSIGSLILALTSKILMLLSSVLLARWIGVEGYGVYVTAMALVMLLTVPTGLGMPALMIRLLASYRVQKKWGLMRGLIIRGNQAVLVASLFMLVLVGIIISQFTSHIGQDHTGIYILALFLIPLISLSAMRSAALRGLHHVILGQLPEHFIMPFLFIVLLVCWWFLSGVNVFFTAEAAIVSRIISTSVAFLIGTFLLVRRMPEQLHKIKAEYQLNVWARSALPLLLIAGISIINMQADILMLAAISDSESAGIYQAATRGADLVAFSLVIVNMAFQPSMAQLHAANENVRLQNITTLGARLATATALPVALMMIFYGEFIMAIVFGEAFSKGYIALAILSGAQLINASTGPASELLKMSGYEREAMYGMIVGVIINVILNFLFIPWWGIMGAAFATGFSMILWNIILVFIVKHRLGLNATVIKI